MELFISVLMWTAGLAATVVKWTLCGTAGAATLAVLTKPADETFQPWLAQELKNRALRNTSSSSSSSAVMFFLAPVVSRAVQPSVEKRDFVFFRLYHSSGVKALGAFGSWFLLG